MGGPETESYFKYVKKFARRLGIFNKIKFWGYVGQEKKFNLLSKSWLLINPSVHEGWGLVNVEANVVGTPVVAYNSPGLVDSVKDGLSGQICGKSPKEMAQAVLSILQDPSKYSKLRKGATIWSKTFDWKKSRKISLKLINKVYLGR